MKLSINLMQRDNDGKDLANVNNKFKALICGEYGGYSAIPCEGGWLSDGGILYKDKGELLIVFVEDKSKVKKFKQLAYGYKISAQQEAVLITINDEMLFI